MSTAVTLQPPAAIFREEQNFAWWTYALLAAIAVMSFVGLGLARGTLPPRLHTGSVEWTILAFGLGLPILLAIGVLRMTTEVAPTHIRISFGWVPTFRQTLSLDAVRSVSVVHYRPIVDCGGWGVRRGRDGLRVLSARGNRGVQLVLADGSRLLIGSQRPEELAATIEKTMPAAS